VRTLDHDSHQPFYLQIAEALREAIHDGEFRPGQKVPSCAALRKHFDVAAGTVNKAVDMLQRKGILVGRPGAGLFVRADAEESVKQDAVARHLSWQRGQWVPMRLPGTDPSTPEADTLELAENGWVEAHRLGDPEGALCIQTWRGVEGQQVGYLLRVEDHTTMSDYLHVSTLPELMDLLARWAPAVQAAAACTRAQGDGDE